jgi:hypothetical protein
MTQILLNSNNFSNDNICESCVNLDYKIYDDSIYIPIKENDIDDCITYTIDLSGQYYIKSDNTLVTKNRLTAMLELYKDDTDIKNKLLETLYNDIYGKKYGSGVDNDDFEKNLIKKDVDVITDGINNYLFIDNKIFYDILSLRCLDEYICPKASKENINTIIFTHSLVNDNKLQSQVFNISGSLINLNEDCNEIIKIIKDINEKITNESFKSLNKLVNKLSTQKDEDYKQLPKLFIDYKTNLIEIYRLVDELKKNITKLGDTDSYKLLCSNIEDYENLTDEIINNYYFCQETFNLLTKISDLIRDNISLKTPECVIKEIKDLLNGEYQNLLNEYENKCNGFDINNLRSIIEKVNKLNECEEQPPTLPTQPPTLPTQPPTLPTQPPTTIPAVSNGSPILEKRIIQSPVKFDCDKLKQQEQAPPPKQPPKNTKISSPSPELSIQQPSNKQTNTFGEP